MTKAHQVIQDKIGLTTVSMSLNALGEMGITYNHSRLDHLARAFRLLLGGGKNLFESNQNFNVPGADGSLTSFNQTFLNGQEFSYGWYVVGGASLINAKIIDGELTADSGKIQRSTIRIQLYCLTPMIYMVLLFPKVARKHLLTHWRKAEFKCHKTIVRFILLSISLFIRMVFL
uniref:hypothetical protein n=1 Tax=Vibrio cholerae TaxID=666 RepID=UPI003F58ADCF